jgi:hypothetical protein
MEGRQKMTGTRNMMIGHQETRGNRQGGTTEKLTRGVANRRETIEGWRKTADAGLYIKASHHAFTVINGKCQS